MPHSWHKRNPSTLNEDVRNLDGGCGLNTDEADLENRARLEVSVQQLLREFREKTKSWVVYSTSDYVDVAFKKVSVFMIWKSWSQIASDVTCSKGKW